MSEYYSLHLSDAQQSRKWWRNRSLDPKYSQDLSPETNEEEDDLDEWIRAENEAVASAAEEKRLEALAAEYIHLRTAKGLSAAQAGLVTGLSQSKRKHAVEEERQKGTCGNQCESSCRCRCEEGSKKRKGMDRCADAGSSKASRRKGCQQEH